MQDRELLGGARERFDPVGSALVLDDLCGRLRPSTSSRSTEPPPVAERPERQHPRHAPSPFERGQRHRLANERLHLVLARPFREHFEREHPRADTVAYGPTLRRRPLSEAANLGS